MDKTGQKAFSLILSSTKGFFLISCLFWIFFQNAGSQLCFRIFFMVEGTNMAVVRPEEQSEKAESSRENLWNEIRLKGPKRQKQTQDKSEKEWASSVALCQRQTHQQPHHVKVSPWGQPRWVDCCYSGLDVNKDRTSLMSGPI